MAWPAMPPAYATPPGSSSAYATPPGSLPKGTGTVPTLGNGYLSRDEWLGLHNEYAARATADPSQIVMIGDSVVYYWGDPHRQARPELRPTIGTPVWDSSIAKLGSASNFGIMGDYTQNVLWRLRHGELDGKPDVVAVYVGINNLGHGDTVADTVDGIKAVVDTIKAESPGSRILLLGLLPPRTSPTNIMRVEAAQVNEWIARLADDRVTFYNPTPKFLEPDGAPVPGLLQDGGIHPTLAGYRVLADAIDPILRRLLAEADRNGV
jgi:beta-glucosidase